MSSDEVTLDRYLEFEVTCVGNYAHGHILAKAVKQQTAFRLLG